MCGIASIFAYNNPSGVDHAELRQIRDQMAHRGPDGSGEWYSPDNRIGLGHRRLSIIDLSEAGRQPMSNQSCPGCSRKNMRAWITYNGELYNYQALRSELIGAGHKFESNSDTEVIIHGYAEWGIEELLPKLRGMFAFALYDSRSTNNESRLILARDPFGIKPLYYANDGKTFYAASQVKALLKSARMDTRPDAAGHVGFFLWGHVPEPYTFYRGIRSLPAGSYMWVDTMGNKKTGTYCSIPEILSDPGRSDLPMSSEQVKSLLRGALLDTVEHHLVADVPVGIFLSSGKDSTTLVALAAEVNQSKINTITMGFREYIDTLNDETPLATLVADQYRTTHRTIWVSKKDFEEDFQHLLQSMDQPTTDGVNSYFVSKTAKKAGLKVALSGLGGDELFGSYPSFSQIPRLVNRLGPFKNLPLMGKSFRIVSYPFLKHMTSPKYAGLFEYGGSYSGAYFLRRGMFMPWELPQMLDGEMIREGWGELQTLLRLEETISKIENPYRRVSAFEMCWYMRNQLLRDTDWAGMAHSIEVRVPLVDVELLRNIAPLLGGTFSPGKKEMASTPLKPLPHEVIERGKTGFSIPTRQWISEDHKELGERSLRGWAKVIYREFAGKPLNHQARIFTTGPKNKLRFLALVPDAFGGHGGIALYNRDLLAALCKHPYCSEVVAIPRLMTSKSEPIPEKLTYMTDGINSKVKYIMTIFQTIKKDSPFDMIICGHINLLPVAYLLRLYLKAPLLLEIYGIDAWGPTNSKLGNYLVNKIDTFISISGATQNRFLRWASLPEYKGFILPNAIHTALYGPGPKNPDLIKRYGLDGKTVLMTFGRLDSRERWKGFDEVLELLPELKRNIPKLAYLIVGQGSDKKRLEQKVKDLDLSEMVIFTGYIPENEKADHYRLADAYVMPSRGEGFGFVFLEAMACGIPVVASKVDGSKEAVLNGKLGILVDPGNPDEVKAGILEALRKPKGVIPDGLDHFSFEHFTSRLHAIIDQVLNDNDGKT